MHAALHSSYRSSAVWLRCARAQSVKYLDTTKDSGVLTALDLFAQVLFSCLFPIMIKRSLFAHLTMSSAQSCYATEAARPSNTCRSTHVFSNIRLWKTTGHVLPQHWLVVFWREVWIFNHRSLHVGATLLHLFCLCASSDPYKSYLVYLGE